MKKLIEILPNVYGVKVPSDAEYYKSVYYVRDNETQIFISNSNESKPLITLDGEFKALGFLTKDEISFDASEVVYCYSKPLGLYKNYKNDTGYVEHLCNAEQSFRSALPEDIYFENVYGSEEPNLEAECCGIWQDNGLGYPICCGQPTPTEESYYLQDLWQTAQENITEKLLILQKL